MIQAATAFQLDGKPIFCARFGSGHINETYLLVDETGREYILQKVNRTVFRDPESLMRNIAAVTGHLRKTAASSREVLTLLPTLDGKDWLVDEAGEYWRLYEYICDNLCLNLAESPEDFRESAVGFGRFQRQLADFPANTLVETIPDFHNTPNRYRLFHEALAADSLGRSGQAGAEIAFALAREEYAATLTRRNLPLRVTHNDTKLNNVLLDRVTRKALCIIDLDTVMPGLVANDFGDSIRFGASTALEDERDLRKVRFSLPHFEAYTNGFLSACGESLTSGELESLCDGAKTMTLECGLRFLTDYLTGDSYFHTTREGQNLDRCRTQFKLVEEMESLWPDMQKIVEKEAKKCGCL